MDRQRAGSGTGQPSAVLVGDSAEVSMLLKQLDLAPQAVRVVGCVLADEPLTPPECRVLGTTRDLPAALRQVKVSVALVSFGSSRSAEAGAVSRALARLGVAERRIPPLGELLAGTATIAAGGVGVSEGGLDPVELIGRTPHGIDRAAVSRVLTGRRVLITGAGGSIGSEIARIVSGFNPEQVVLVERSENALFEIDRQIGRRFPGVARKAVLHDVVDADGTLRHVVSVRPDVVFHAAAHKHVPLMEEHPFHAVNNNLFGTKAIADAAAAVGAERFVLVSTDKAVNPTSVMGATKRLAELYVMGLHRQSLAGGSPTRFSMVRFGNVLGSACSVMPIWESQFREGGPLTVTDPRMTRYFMTIHEAAALVIQAGAIDDTGESAAVYVLDMGEPVRILDLAQRYILGQHRRARVVYGDGSISEVGPEDGRGTVTIQITGVRPGEKLHEELAYQAELLRPTPYPGIKAWAGEAPERLNVAAMVAELSAVRHAPERESVLAVIRRFVPELGRAVESAAAQSSPASASARPAPAAHAAREARGSQGRDVEAAA